MLFVPAGTKLAWGLWPLVGFGIKELFRLEETFKGHLVQPTFN